MNPTALGVITATVWFVVHLGYVLLAGLGSFWAIVWPEGQSLRRLRGLAAVGLALAAVGTVGEALVDRSAAPHLLVRLAVLALAGFYGPELLRNPVRGRARLIVVALSVILTATLVVDSATPASPQAAVSTATSGIYLLALAAWLGGLVALGSLLATRDRSGRLDQLWSRSAWLAGLSVLALAVTGAVQHLVVRGTATSRSGVLLLVEGVVLVATLLLSRYAVTRDQRLAFRERYLPGSTAVPDDRPAGDDEAMRPRLVLFAALIAVAVAQLAVLPIPARPGPPPLGDPVPTVPTRPVTTAREARPAPSDRGRFVPERIALPDGASAAVVPVSTVGRELVVPEEPGKVGWWDGSSYVGDDYGSTVIAGHVDTLDRGVGFFVRLWEAEVGERIVVSAGNARQAYTITKLRQVPRTDLVDDEEVFAVDGPPRLVLITCTGEFRPERGGYSRNLVVVASPVR
jgi:LPXTG-site transpeptidase (sortase) family protein